MTDRFSIFSARLRKISLTFAFLSGGAMLLMMLAGSFDIIGTSVFSRPIPAAFEFIETMTVVVAFFAISLAQARRAHIRVELVYSFMPRPLQISADVLQFLLSAVFYGLIAYFGWRRGCAASSRARSSRESSTIRCGPRVSRSSSARR